MFWGKINKTDKSNHKFEIEIDDYLYSFSIRMIPEKDREWFLDILSYQMQKIHNRAVRKTEKEIKSNIRAALGV